MTTAVDRALYETTHDFPGGVEAVAARLGRAVGTIYHKADPGCETHQFSVQEALALMLASGDFRIARALCREIDHACIPYGDYRNCSDLELLDCYTALHVEIGETAAELRGALARGRVTHEDAARIRREIQEDIEAALALLSRVEGLARD